MLKKVLKVRSQIENSSDFIFNTFKKSIVEIHFESYLDSDVTLFKNEMFTVKYIKETQKFVLETVYSNLEINDEFMNQLMILKKIVDNANK